LAFGALLCASACKPGLLKQYPTTGSAPAAVPTVQPLATPLAVTNDARVRVRPIKGVKVVDEVQEGDQVDTLGRMDRTEYYLVLLPSGQTGYIHEDFVTLAPVARRMASRLPRRVRQRRRRPKGRRSWAGRPCVLYAIDDEIVRQPEFDPSRPPLRQAVLVEPRESEVRAASSLRLRRWPTAMSSVA
jgi:hypothetical protein